MSLTLTYRPVTFSFKFAAGTSRGILRERISWIIQIKSGTFQTGIGEIAPLSGLSIDEDLDFPGELSNLAEKLKLQELPEDDEGCLNLALGLCGERRPSIRFGLEMAFLDALNGGKRILFPSAFTQGNLAIPINGLIWMGDVQFMRKQIDQKIAEGFGCLKMKIGAINFEQERKILKEIRERFRGILRVDANGAFLADEAESKINSLAKYDLHSIEQPIRQNQIEDMARICQHPAIAVALDEELIGVPSDKQEALLRKINPQYIILKPTLLGGIMATKKWIEMAELMNIGWWITSALESNIGLNAISQLAASLQFSGHQGLGTGQLYVNNIISPLVIQNGHLSYDPEREWKIEFYKHD